MTEPKPGDVWESPRGTIVFVHKIGAAIAAIEQFGGAALLSELDWTGYTLRFRDGKPVPAAPQGETVTVECAVLVSIPNPGGVFIRGDNESSPALQVCENTRLVAIAVLGDFRGSEKIDGDAASLN